MIKHGSTNKFQENSTVQIVTKTQGMKNIDTIFSNNYGAKSLIMMTNQEIESCINIDRIHAINEIVSEEDKFMKKFTVLTQQQKFDIVYTLKCVMNDFRNAHDLFNKTKS